MQQLNLDYKLKIFTDEEIDAIGAFSYEIGPGYFINFYPPYEILALFPKFLRIQKFLKADFIPAYQKESFWQGIINADKIQEKQESTIIGNNFNFRTSLLIIAIIPLKNFYKNPSQKHLTNKCSYVIL